MDINAASETELQRIKGVGPTFARRIANYRSSLGGFCKIDQLKEVFGLDSNKYAEIAPQVNIIDSSLQKLNINHAEPVDLIKHPYISTWNLANAIQAYRKTHGAFESPKDLLNIQLVDSIWLKKMLPYLTTNEN